MKTPKLALSIIAITLALLLPLATAEAQATVTEFSGRETCGPPISHGTFTSPDGNFHLRGMVLVCRDENDLAAVTGTNTIVVNGNWDPDFGPAWGTWEVVVDTGGSWAGTWEGMKTPSGFVIHGQGMGAGIYEGMHYWVDLDAGILQGRIFNPHG